MSCIEIPITSTYGARGGRERGGERGGDGGDVESELL